MNHTGCWENTRKACKSRAVWFDLQAVEKFSKHSKFIALINPQKETFIAFYERTIKNVCQKEENLLYFRD